MARLGPEHSVGVVVEPQGAWPLADERACGVADPTVETVYTVSFAAADLWGAGDHRVTVDLWESYLELVEPADPRPRRVVGPPGGTTR